MDTLTFERWCAFLAVAVLRTRTSFSAFFFATMHLPRSHLTSTSPAFPLPVPHVGIFERMPPGLSAIRRRKWHFRRALHVVVMALNFWWSGSSSISMELLGRIPSPSHKSIYRRIASLMLADGPSQDFCPEKWPTFSSTLCKTVRTFRCRNEVRYWVWPL